MASIWSHPVELRQLPSTYAHHSHLPHEINNLGANSSDARAEIPVWNTCRRIFPRSTNHEFCSKLRPGRLIASCNFPRLKLQSAFRYWPALELVVPSHSRFQPTPLTNVSHESGPVCHSNDSTGNSGSAHRSFWSLEVFNARLSHICLWICVSRISHQLLAFWVNSTCLMFFEILRFADLVGNIPLALHRAVQS